MAVSNTTVKIAYPGNGVTTAFAIPFAHIVSDSSETKVYRKNISDPLAITESLLTEGALQDYTLTGASPPGTPFDTHVTMNAAPSANHVIIVIRSLPLTQTMDADESGSTPLEDMELALDRVVAQVQELNEKISRMPQARLSDAFSSNALPQPFATYLLRVNEAGTAWDYVDPDELVEASTNTGLSATVETTILDSQTNTNITGMLLDETEYTSAIIFCEIIRSTTVFSNLVLYLQYINGAWRVAEGLGNGEAHGLTFSISSGQVRYSSGSEGVGTLKYRMLRFEV